MLAPGTCLNHRYRILRSIDRGYASQIFEIEDRHNPGVPKVLKVLLTGQPKAVSAFQREAEVLSQFNAPGIVKIEPDGYFCETLDGSVAGKSKGTLAPHSSTLVHCLVMEKVPGSNLEDWLYSQNPPRIQESQAIALLKQLVAILDVLHRRGYYHRDIKPSNIMRRPDGRLVLIDFGTVREIVQTFSSDQGEPVKRTRVGTAGYAPPEQLGGRSEKRSDFYALGCTMICLLTGQEPDELPYEGSRILWRDQASPVSDSFATLLDWLVQPVVNERPKNTQMIRRAIAQIEAEQARIPSWSAMAKTLLWSSLITAFWLGVRSLGLLQPAELWAYDVFMGLRPLEEPDERITLITIDDDDIAWQDAQGMEREPSQSLSDEALWQLLSRLEDLQPRVIGLDLYRDFPVSAAYPELAEYLETSDRIIGVCKASDVISGDVGIRPPPEINPDSIGFSDTVVDLDNVVRRHLLYMPKIERSPCVAEYSFSTLVALEYLNESGEFLPDHSWKIRDTVFRRMTSSGVGYQTSQIQGGQVLLNYRSLNSLHDIASTISLRNFLNPDVSIYQSNDLKNQIILVGVTAESSMDWHKTPFMTEGSRRVPGIFLQAHRASQIISSVLDNRPMLESWKLSWQVIWAFGWSWLGGLSILFLKQRRYQIGIILVFFISLLGMGFWLIIQGTWLPILVPAVILMSLMFKSEVQTMSLKGHRAVLLKS